MPLRDDRAEVRLGVFSALIYGSIGLVVLTIILLLGMVLVGGAASGLGGTAPPVNKTASPDPVTGQAVPFEDTWGNAEILQVYSVKDSTGRAVSLTGADDSYVQSKKSVTLASDSTWSVSTWARANNSTTMTAVSASGRVLIQYDASTGNWSAWYYDEGARNSYVVNVSAPNQPGNLTLVTATANSTHFWIYANTTRGETEDITVSSIENAELDATNWNGTLDETRTFDDTTNDTLQAELYNNPVAPRPDRNRTARLMYDEGQGSVTAIYFTGTQAELSNFTWTQGLDGHVLTDGVDYTLDQSAGSITALAGGAIDGAPVVWIDYEFKDLNRVGQLARVIEPAFELFGTSTLVIPAVAVLSVLIGGLIGALSMGAGMELDFGEFKKGGR